MLKYALQRFLYMLLVLLIITCMCFVLVRMLDPHTLPPGDPHTAVVEARRQAQAMLAKADADIAQQRKKAVNEVKDELGGIAVDIAAKVVGREVSAEDHAALIDEFIQNVGDAS